MQHNVRAALRQIGRRQGRGLLHLDRGAYHRINPIGVNIWNAIGDGSELGDLVEAVRKTLSMLRMACNLMLWPSLRIWSRDLLALS